MYNLIPNLNIKENVETGAYLSDHPLDVDEILKTLGLYEHRHKLPSQLSGGQQQRCSIGRAIVKNRLLCFHITQSPFFQWSGSEKLAWRVAGHLLDFF